jgi:hypothetical protein
MITLAYRREVAYPRDVVLEQYFDLEHLEHVHPRTLGRATLVSTRRRTVAWELRWSARLGWWRPRSRFAMEYEPPDTVRTSIVSGWLRGTTAATRFDRTATGTLVVELYHVPLPAWLSRPLQWSWARRLDRVWDEDLAVMVPHYSAPGEDGYFA